MIEFMCDFVVGAKKFWGFYRKVGEDKEIIVEAKYNPKKKKWVGVVIVSSFPVSEEKRRVAYCEDNVLGDVIESVLFDALEKDGISMNEGALSVEVYNNDVSISYSSNKED